MTSDAAPTPPSPSDGSPEQFRRTALLLADLGRYHEAADELAAGLAVAPGDPGLLTTLARVHLAADQPAEALTAAARAAVSAPDTIGPLVVRAMALADTRRFREAAQIGVEVLRRWPDDPYAQRTGAALLSECRNGQEALNAAWGAVNLSPTDAEAHLVLGVVSARLRLFDLAQRAYGEALELDPALGDAQHDLGIVRLERRRWAKALEELADAAALAPPSPDSAGPPSPGRPAGSSVADDLLGGGSGVLDVSRPTGPVLDRTEESTDALRQLLLYATNGILVAGLVAALMAASSPGASRAWAAVIGALVLIALPAWLKRQLPEPIGAVLTRLQVRDRRQLIAFWVAVLSPVLFIAYAAVGGVVPLVAAMGLAAAAELLVLTRRN